MRQKETQILYCLLQGFYWMLFCVGVGYINTYLTGVGLNTSQVGVITATFGAISAVVQPILGKIADQHVSFGWSIQIKIMLALCLICNVILLSTKSQLLSGIACGFILLLLNAMMPFVNGASFYYRNNGCSINFGVARGFGSMFYAVISFLLGKWVASKGITSITISGMIITGLMLLVVFLMPYQKGTTAVHKLSTKESGKKTNFIKEYPKFMGMLLGIMLLLMFHNNTNTYMLQIMEGVGGGSEEMGITFALCAILEIPVLFGFSLVVKRISAYRLLIISGFAFSVKAFMYSIVDTVIGIYAAQFLQIFSFALFVAASVYYVEEQMDDNNKLKGQSLLGSALTFGGVFGNLLGGIVIQRFGIKTNLLASLILAILGAFIVIMMGDKREKPIEAEK